MKVQDNILVIFCVIFTQYFTFLGELILTMQNYFQYSERKKTKVEGIIVSDGDISKILLKNNMIRE